MKLEITNPCINCITRPICRIPRSNRPSDCKPYHEAIKKIRALISYLHVNTIINIEEQFNKKGKVVRRVRPVSYKNHLTSYKRRRVY